MHYIDHYCCAFVSNSPWTHVPHIHMPAFQVFVLGRGLDPSVVVIVPPLPCRLIVVCSVPSQMLALLLFVQESELMKQPVDTALFLQMGPDRPSHYDPYPVRATVRPWFTSHHAISMAKQPPAQRNHDPHQATRSRLILIPMDDPRSMVHFAAGMHLSGNITPSFYE